MTGMDRIALLASRHSILFAIGLSLKNCAIPATTLSPFFHPLFFFASDKTIFYKNLCYFQGIIECCVKKKIFPPRITADNIWFAIVYSIYSIVSKIPCKRKIFPIFPQKSPASCISYASILPKRKQERFSIRFQEKNLVIPLLNLTRNNGKRMEQNEVAFYSFPPKGRQPTISLPKKMLHRQRENCLSC